MEWYTPVQEGADVFTEQYKPWLQVLKYALYNFEDSALGVIINDGTKIFKMMPEQLRPSTFLGQPSVIEFMIGLWHITQDHRDSQRQRRYLLQWIVNWEISQPVDFMPPSAAPPLAIPLSVLSTVAQSPTLSSVPPTVSPSAVYAPAKHMGPWEVITPVAQLSTLSSVPSAAAPSPALSSVPPKVSPSAVYASAEHMGPVPPSSAPSRSPSTIPPSPSAELPVPTAQPNSESDWHPKPTDEGHLIQTEEAVGSKAELGPLNSSVNLKDLPPCNRCIKAGITCILTANPNSKTCTKCHTQKQKCARKGRKLVRGESVKLAIIPADKEEEYTGQPKRFENEFQIMKKSVEELQAKNQEIAARHDGLIAYTDRQFKLLHDAIKNNFSDNLKKLADEGKSLKNISEFQLMINETLQNLIQLVTHLSRPAGGSHPCQSSGQDNVVY